MPKPKLLENVLEAPEPIQDDSGATIKSTALASMLGLTRGYLDKLSKEIGVSTVGPGIYPLHDYVHTYVCGMRVKWQNTSKSDSEDKGADLKVRLLAVQVHNAELDFETRVGNVVSAAEVEKEALSEGRKTRDAFMRLPSQLAPELASESDPHKVLMRLEEVMRTTLADLSGAGDE